MNNEAPNLAADLPNDHSLRCKLTYHLCKINVLFSKEVVFKTRPGYMFAVAIGLDSENQNRFKIPEFLVFQVRVTSSFELEQAGDGVPCNDEARAKELVKIIEAKNVAVPRVGMANWAGHFGIVTIDNFEVWYEELVLFNYHEPQKIGEQLSKFSLRYWRRCLGRPAEMVKEEMLPTIDLQTAQQMFKSKNEELQKYDVEEKTKPNQSKEQINLINNSATLLLESQFLVLSKAFPETIKLMRKVDVSSPEDVYAAYKRDVFALTGNLEDTLPLTKPQFEDLVIRIRKNKRNARKSIDPIEYELVGGWFFKGYSNMTPEQRGKSLRKLGLKPPSSDAIRKICARLKLPRIRKPGRHK